MAYVKIIYQNSPSTATPINAQNLNHMDDGIAENDRRLNELETAGVVNKFNNRTGNVTPEKNDYDISLIGATAGEDGYVPVWRNSGTEEDPNWGFEMEAQGGSGHEILDADGTSMAQEDALQFADSFVSDDDVNGKTVVENIKEHSTKADYDDATEDGFHVIDDGEDAVIHPSSEDYVEVVADGNTTFATLLNYIYSHTDMSKLNKNAYIVINSGAFEEVFNVSAMNGYGIPHYFAVTWLNTAPNDIVESIYFQQNDCAILTEIDGTKTNQSNSKPSNGTKITLYYGNKKAVVDLQTTANRCLYDSNTNVKQKLDTKADTSNIVSGSVSLPYVSSYYCQKDITIPTYAKVVANFLYGIGAYNKTTGIMVLNIDATTSRIIAFSSGGSYVTGDSVDVNYIAVKS